MKHLIALFLLALISTGCSEGFKSKETSLSSILSLPSSFDYEGTATPVSTNAVVADGIQNYSINVSLRKVGKDNNGLTTAAVGVTPEILVQGTNNTASCSVTNESGDSTCRVSSTRAELKQISVQIQNRIVDPVVLLGQMNADFVAGPSFAIAIVSGNNQIAFVNEALALQPVIRVTDANNNLVKQREVVFSATTGRVQFASVMTNDLGEASPGTWTMSNVAGAHTLQVTSGSAAASLTATARALPVVTTITFNQGAGQSARVGSNVATSPQILVRDQYNQPMANVTINFTPAADVATSSATSNALGLASPGTWRLSLAGTNTLTASSAGITGTLTATGVAPVPTTITFNQGAGQSARVGSNVATNPQVRVMDQFNLPLSGVTVSFTPAANVGLATAVTNNNGDASPGSWRLVVAGLNTLTASAGGRSADLTATGITPVVTSIAFNRGSGQTAVINSNVAVSPQVIVMDQFNLPLSGVSVTFSPAANVTTSTVMTDAAGLASPGSWRLSVVGTNTLTASSDGRTANLTAVGTAVVGPTLDIVLFPKGLCERDNLEIYANGVPYTPHRIIRVGECIEAERSIASTFQAKCIDLNDRTIDSELTLMPENATVETVQNCVGQIRRPQ